MLQDCVNLVILFGLCDGMLGVDVGQFGVVVQLFDVIDRVDLWGCVVVLCCYDVIELCLFYVLVVQGGVFINLVLYEFFGLILIEVVQVGVLLVVMCNGGLVDILEMLGVGVLVDLDDFLVIVDVCMVMLDQLFVLMVQV